MMTGRDLVERPLEFVADELPPEDRSRCEAHLRGCPSCAAYSESYQFVIRLGRSLNGDPLPYPAPASTESLRPTGPLTLAEVLRVPASALL
jgi:anti-sigma factor RsiW